MPGVQLAGHCRQRGNAPILFWLQAPIKCFGVSTHGSNSEFPCCNACKSTLHHPRSSAAGLAAVQSCRHDSVTRSMGRPGQDCEHWRLTASPPHHLTLPPISTTCQWPARPAASLSTGDTLHRPSRNLTRLICTSPSRGLFFLKRDRITSHE